MSTETTDDCPEGGRHLSNTHRNDDGTTYEQCGECGELLSDDDA